MKRFSIPDPRQLLSVRTRFSYEKLPGGDSQSNSPLFSSLPAKWRQDPRQWRFGWPRVTLTRIVGLLIVIVLVATSTGIGLYRTHLRHEEERRRGLRHPYHWESFPRLNGFYSGIYNLVPPSDLVPEQAVVRNATAYKVAAPKYTPPAIKEPPLDPEIFNPYPDYKSLDYLETHSPVQPCFLDEEKKVELPDVYVYPGIPQNMTDPSFGSYKELGLNSKVCYDRFSRYATYGYGFSKEEGGLGMSGKSEAVGADKIWRLEKKVDYRNVKWAKAQQTCYEKNKIRFDKTAVNAEGQKPDQSKKTLPRHAYILRTWTGYKWTDYQMLALRAMISELSLKSGGEYDIHFLVHVKDDSIPIWASDEVYQKTLQDNVPEEFWGMATLWSEQQMKMFYPEPFPDNVFNHAKAPIHSVYRSAHFALQWFSQFRPEYDFYWNWEMDLRYTGHYYEFNTQVGEWAKRQPRKGIWERNSRYFIPDLHGSWQNFTELVEEEVLQSEEEPVWGPPEFENRGMIAPPEDSQPPRNYSQDNYEWGVGEDADLITFNPIFDPAKTNWVFREDVTGYDLNMPIPPRRCAIITVSRLSKRLLDIMHKETYHMRHHMFPEMWPPSVAFHHGLKAVYAPHAVYFDRNWPLETLDKTFNYPPVPEESVFGWGEHNQLGSSFYYNSGFSSALWRRWLGSKENQEGGNAEEMADAGRMCLRPILFHPIKKEYGTEADQGPP
ncbi:uncharacterized protein BDZ99DRAFT_402765 [Mytilinidion resinicola]|uniref:Uncharacterized protein n=1 Tax=Mytilinidion resinicola TaxID=574789 RepID=A0A6A6Y0B1_9PEZI|nr:uncharacterized protein BDZ99DRAFT_402765 [Mytilinidion resinicola]KAF2801655.1 hypothetical protein BDZ99DRAFT_402765 [Mytilinidion resinicola]